MTDWIYEGVYFALMAVLEWPADVSEGTETDHVTRHERSIENYYIATGRDATSWDFRWSASGTSRARRCLGQGHDLSHVPHRHLSGSALDLLRGYQ